MQDSKKQYALDHIKKNCEKYGSNMVDTLIALNDSMESGGNAYSEIVTQLKRKFIAKNAPTIHNAVDKGKFIVISWPRLLPITS